MIVVTFLLHRKVHKAAVIRGFCVMNFPFLKKKIDIQIEEYLAYKARYSLYAAEAHKEILKEFIKIYKPIQIEDIRLESIEDFYNNKTSEFKRVKSMEALRGLIRYHRRALSLNPKTITNQGVNGLTSVEQSAIIPVMKKKKIGRPYADIELIKRVKRLRDREGLKFRTISAEIKKDVSHVYKMYHYNLTPQ